MEKFLELLINFAKDNGVGVSVPIAIWVVVKVWFEDRKAKKDIGDQNHDDIGELKLKMATAEEAIENLKKAIY